MPFPALTNILELDSSVVRFSQEFSERSPQKQPSSMVMPNALSSPLEVRPLTDLEIESLDETNSLNILSDKVTQSSFLASKNEVAPEIPPKVTLSDQISLQLGVLASKKGDSVGSLSIEEIERITRKLIAHTKKSFRIDPAEPCTEEASQKTLKDLTQACLIEVGGKKILMFKDRIGEGGKGEIFLGITADGKMCAIKRYLNAEESVFKEAALLEHCQKSPHIIQSYASDEKFLVLEFCRFDLECLDYQNESIDPEFLNQYIDDALGFLIELHDKKVVHLDIKPANLRVRLGHLKLLDFDTAFLANGAQNQIGGGTIGYYDPKQIAYYCEHNQELLRAYDIPGFERSNLRENTLDLPINTWQTMLSLVEISFHSLSPSFQERFSEYREQIIKECAQKARTYIADSSWLENLGISYLDFQKQYSREFNARFTLLYMGFAHQKFEELKKERAGLFADLSAETPLEELLIEMSYFDENRRISPDQIGDKFEEAHTWVG